MQGTGRSACRRPDLFIRIAVVHLDPKVTLVCHHPIKARRLVSVYLSNLIQRVRHYLVVIIKVLKTERILREMPNPTKKS